MSMSVVDIIKHYQRSIEKCQGNHERMLHCISKLYRLPVTVQHLQDTGIGRTVNNLRKYEGETGDAAKALVSKWKAMVAAEDSSEGEDQDENQQNLVEDEERPHRQEDNHKTNKHRSHDREKLQHREKTHHEKDRSETHHEKDRSETRHEKDRSETHHEKDRSHHDRDRSHRDKEKSDDRDRSHRDREKSVQKEKSRHERPRSQHEKDKSHHNKKQNVDERSKKSSSNEEYRKRKYEEENGKKSEKRRRKHETESESSESEDNFVVAADNESEVDSDTQSTSQTSQNFEDDSSEEEPIPQKHKNHVTKEHGKNHSSSKERGSNRDQSAHGKDKDKSKHKTESGDRKGEKRKVDSSKKQKSSHIPEKDRTKIKKEKVESEDGSIDCSMGASFAEALGMVDPIVKKKPVSVSSPSTSSASRSSKSTSSPKKKDISSKSAPSELNLLAPNVKLEPLEVDLDATLPPITPHYKPLPHYNFLDSPPHRKVKQLTEEEALSQVMSTKNQRTKVYSGVKSGKSWATIPSLYDICVRVLQENIDALEYTGGVPYDLLKPVLQHANPEQLFMLEHHNPYLIDDTDELWKFHCQKEFRTKQRLDMETSREMYLRCRDEREKKLRDLTTNIQQSIANSTPVRQTKLAYVDSFAKPPRNVARQQAKFGTAHKVSKPSPVAKATAKVNAVAASVSSIATPVPPPRSVSTVAKQKPRMAPLMQKTMKLVKSFKR